MITTVATGVYRRASGRLIVAWRQGGRLCRKMLPRGATITDAKAFRKVKLGEAASGKLGVLPGRFTFEALLKLLPTGRKGPSRALREAWSGTMLARDITADKIAAFERERLAAGRARATVNNDLAALRHACRLAVRARLLAEAPYVSTPDPHNARQGFFEPAELAKVVDKLEPWARGPVECGHLQCSSDGVANPLAGVCTMSLPSLPQSRVDCNRCTAGSRWLTFTHFSRPFHPCPGRMRISRGGRTRSAYRRVLLRR